MDNPNSSACDFALVLMHACKNSHGDSTMAARYFVSLAKTTQDPPLHISVDVKQAIVDNYGVDLTPIIAEWDNGIPPNGTIPEEIFKLDGLVKVFLNNNHFEGPIPTDIAKMTALTQLHLWNNRLTGPIPTEIGLLSKLETLTLSQNELSGLIPTEIQSLEMLSRSLTHQLTMILVE